MEKETRAGVTATLTSDERAEVQELQALLGDASFRSVVMFGTRLARRAIDAGLQAVVDDEKNS